MSKLRRSLDELKQTLADDLHAEEKYAVQVRELAIEYDEPTPPEEKEDERAYDLIDEASRDLAQDGRDFVATLCWMATGAGFTAPSISLLLTVAAYEDTKERDERGCEITDPELAEFKGCSERTIQRWRQQYLKEEKYLKVPFLQITEGDFDKGLNANRPTRYRFLVALDIADAVREAREMKLYEEGRHRALKLSAIRVYDSLSKPLGTAAIRRRKKRVLTPESERRRLLNMIRTSVAKLKELEDEGGGMADWEGLKNELEAIYKSSNPAQVVAEIKHNPMGRQSVVPSVPDVAVSKEMPSDAPLSEYLRVPSIARAARRSSVEGHYE